MAKMVPKPQTKGFSILIVRLEPKPELSRGFKCSIGKNV